MSVYMRCPRCGHVEKSEDNQQLSCRKCRPIHDVPMEKIARDIGSDLYNEVRELQEIVVRLSLEVESLRESISCIGRRV